MIRFNELKKAAGVSLILIVLLISPIMAEDNFDNIRKIRVFVSVPPQAISIKAVAGQYADIKILVRPGRSPATYEPTPKQMAELSKADVYFRIGVPFEEPLLKKITKINPDLKIVDMRDGIALRDMEDDHEHGHHHGAKDPHVWLDPLLVKQQAETVRKYLLELNPQIKSSCNSGYADLCVELDSVHSYLELKLKPYAGRKFFVYHPTLGYFADRYGLKQVAIETEGKEPGARHIADLISLANENRIMTIFVQPQFSSKNAEIIAKEIGGTALSFDLLPSNLSSYVETLKQIADALVADNKE